MNGRGEAAYRLADRRLVPGEHVGGAGDGTGSGTDRSADDCAHGTSARIAFRGAGRLPGYSTRYRVSVPEMPHRLANAMTVCITRHTVMSRHRRARCGGCQNRGDRKYFEPGVHHNHPEACPERQDRCLWDLNTL